MYRSPRKKERKAEKEKKSSRSVELSLFVLLVFSAQKAVVELCEHLLKRFCDQNYIRR